MEQGLPTELVSALPRVAAAPLRGGGGLRIPVVFHVVWNTAAENIPSAAIQAVVNQMNQDYAAANPDLSGVRAPFTGVIGQPNIEFCLAQFDPAGNPTDGITRTQTTATWFNPDTQTDAMKSPPLGRSPWDPTRYLNIWVCDITSGAGGGGITLGYAYLPVGGMVGSAIDGIVIDYQYGMALSSRTATHEAGHYLGLLHPWGNSGGCGQDDGFTDTPNTDTPTFSCANTNLMKCGVLTQYENFMDYSNCPAMFTQQQGAYMTGVLTGVRASLLTSTGCSQSPSPYCIPTSTNGTADGDFVNSVQLGSINNVNSGGTSAPTYTNFSVQWSTNLTRGSQYTITIQGGTYFPNRYAAWIDYDHNGTFGTSEKLGEWVSGSAGQSQGITFTVPAGSTLGTTRMRVRGVFVNTGEPNPVEPCFNYAWGETEDYGITLVDPGPNYCIPTSLNGTNDGDFINGVQLAGINNMNSGGIGAPTYTNYGAQWSASLPRGTQQTITIQGGTYTPNRYAAWIDYDQNGTFSSGEKLGEWISNTAGQTQGITFTVPVGATLGSTRLRVRGAFINTGEPTPVDPCYDYAWGETEDYTVSVTTSTAIAETGGPGFQLYPNPATDRVYLVLDNERPARALLVDASGREAGHWTIAGDRAELSVGHLSPGLYVLRVEQGEVVGHTRLEMLGAGR